MIVDSPRVEPPTVAPGVELVPGYQVVAHLRRGRRLDVYDAWSTHRQARCVVKLVRPDRVAEPHTAVFLRREGELLRDLAHPHLVRVYELVEEPQLAVVMETLTGPSLADAIDERGRLHPTDVALIGAQLASALRYLHLHGCIHGDVTPGNILLEGGTTKLIDLSLSEPPGPLRPGTGTSGYQAPEQVDGGEQTAATDVFGLGAVLLEALTGYTYDEPAPRWPRDVVLRARQLRIRGQLRLVRQVIDGCMRPDPGDRLTLTEVTGGFGALVELLEA